MGNKKNVKRPKGGGEKKKSPLWVRDILNLIGGAVVGGLTVFIVSSYLSGRATKETSQLFTEDLKKAIPALSPMVERYLEVTDGKKKDAKDLLEGMDLSKPVHPLDLYRDSSNRLGSLDKTCLVRLLEFYRNLDEAELYRKLILKDQQRPDQIVLLMQREFLRALYESSQLTSHLFWDLKADRGK
jgi:hypothetical protein